MSAPSCLLWDAKHYGWMPCRRTASQGRARTHSTGSFRWRTTKVQNILTLLYLALLSSQQLAASGFENHRLLDSAPIQVRYERNSSETGVLRSATSRNTNGVWNLEQLYHVFPETKRPRNARPAGPFLHNGHLSIFHGGPLNPALLMFKSLFIWKRFVHMLLQVQWGFSRK